MYPEHVFERTPGCGVSRKPVVVRRNPSGVAPEGLRRRFYCVIRVSGPGVYGECADR